MPGWALFLDRDGVINQRIPDDYIKHPDQFEFIPGVTNALARLAKIFNPIIIVTNQQGIGRGLMTVSQLEVIHKNMVQEISAKGGRIDEIYYSPDLKNTRSFTRKPAVGLALQARKKFPTINFKNSIIVGDSYSDILFGYRLGMITVLIGTDSELAFKCSGMLDYSFSDLMSFADFLENIPK